ncbi:hypothetical protein [Vibrio coralliirubri]|uniref:hypothetical protein n=1 Tax=Vibrio coralliirubri TaxID=1516159 RepID=UPI0013C4398D|nr:hypothetical protein [Vibrio coralliirubri]
MAVYSVVVAKGSKKNFFDGISNGIWGFTSESKMFPKKQKAPVIGDYVVFGFALHQNPKVAKGGFPRVDSFDLYLNHFKPYSELLTLCQIVDVCNEQDHSIVTNSDGEEIWFHKESTEGNHKFPYRIRLKALETYDGFDFLNDGLSHDLVEAFRLSSADVGSLRFASERNVLLGSGQELEVRERVLEITPESKATQKLIDIESNKRGGHFRKGTKEYSVTRAEGLLVSEFCSHLNITMTGAKPRRTQITMPNGTNLYTDITLDNMLIEAKSDVSRNSIRTAIGQLFDYENLLSDDFQKAVLVPKRPENSLCDLVRKLGFTLIYKSGEDFIKEDCCE